MVDRSRYRRLTELYTLGTELVLRDGNVVFVKALNPYEQQEARQDAQVARARIVMALQEFGSDELDKVKSTFFVDGRAGAITKILDHRASDALLKATDEVANDPDWKERLEIAERTDEILAKPPEDPERKLLHQINEQYLVDVNKRIDDEVAYQRTTVEAQSDDELIEEYIKIYIELYGQGSAIAEHQLTSMWYAIRVCEAVPPAAGDAWDHSKCDGHQVQLYESKVEVRYLPEELQNLYKDTLRELDLTVREAKNSDRQGSSSASSPLPSAEGESIPSTPDAILVSAPGT